MSLSYDAFHFFLPPGKIRCVINSVSVTLEQFKKLKKGQQISET